MNYTEYVQQIATMAVVPVNDPNYQIIIPQMINYAELRMQRDLDFLSTMTSNTTYSLTANTNILNIATGAFITLQTIQVQNSAGTITPLLPVTKEYLQNVWGSSGSPGTPQLFAVYGGDAASGGETFQNVMFGPWADTSYNVILTGTIRAEPLSATNTTTYISVYLPDLMIMASMIYISAYQRNFGRMNDDPQMAQSYESQYQALKASAMVEESRKKFQAAAWSSMAPAPVASPTR
jgi:hypothetical protein